VERGKWKKEKKGQLEYLYIKKQGLTSCSFAQGVR
jgi:hypothetical protein